MASDTAPPVAPAPPPPDDVAAAIIAGGAARRLGGRIKALLTIDGQPVLDRQLAVLAPRCAAIAISANDPASFQDRGLPVIPDAHPGLGPLAGIAAALAWCPAPHLLVVAGDMPYLEPGIIDLLLSRRSAAADAIVPFIGALPEPLFALYRRSCLSVVEQRLAAGQRKVASLILDAGLVIERVDERALRAVDPQLRCFTNLNSVADLPPGTA